MIKGMFVDTSICIGCKACQVACKAWNGLAAEPAHFRKDAETALLAGHFTGNSYDNTEKMSATDWRHVSFIEDFNSARTRSRWLFSSDSCKHCTDAACLNSCPFQAIIRTDLGNVVVLQDKCKGAQACITACPYGAINYSEKSGTSWKCTLCNDRIHNGLGTACSKVCPTDSIRFGELAQLKKIADARLSQLRASGESRAHIYGYTEAKGLNVFYLLLDKPTVYGLPENPKVFQKAATSLAPSAHSANGGLITDVLAALFTFRERGGS